MRIATNGPLLGETMFKEWWDDTFGARHALILDIQNSDEFLAKLVLCQKKVLQSSGAQGCDVKSVAKTLSFAKQRFDSMAGPQFTFCVIFVAIAMLLAFVASDARQQQASRERARRRLEQMPRQLLCAGLSASYADEALRFVRLLDKGGHDLALTYREKREFLHRSQMLFEEGRIFDIRQDGQSSTPLDIVWEQARRAPPLYYDLDGKVLNLFRKPTREESTALADSIKAVTHSMRDRVEAELPMSDLGLLFTSFDLHRWQRAKEDMEQRQERNQLLQLERQAGSMFRSWRLDATIGVPALASAAFRLCGKFQGSGVDNRKAWAEMLSDDSPNGMGRTDLIIMLHIYLSALDSTCGVERDLGALEKVLHAHRGNLDDDCLAIADCTEILLDGPQEECELVGTDRLPTAFLRECAALWVAVRGRRFRVYRITGRKPGPKGGRAGTFAEARRGVKRALDELVAGPRGDPHQPTMLGLTRAQLSGALPTNHPARSDLKSFDDLTRRKVLASTRLACARRAGCNPYATAGFNPNDKLRKGKMCSGAGVRGDELIFRRSGGRIVVVSCCREGVPRRDGYIVRQLDVSARNPLSTFSGGAIVLTEHTWLADGQSKMSDAHLAGFCAASALGLLVIARSRWGNLMPGGPRAGSFVRYRPAATLVERSLLVSKSF